ncbi:IS21 family transposase [Ligilactobacillus ruminis]|uniref:IS21 family transposase n=1 Tax=Ligilactobacillus ruminis TaxID=1623 RepID=UPI0022E6BF4B|nr:IS21 family transposase [Ligilactobacillus ruminis]
MRKDVYERMRHFVLEKIKPNYSAVARQYDFDPRTVKAAYLRAQSDKTSVVRKHRNRRSKLDGYQDIIEDKYAACCSARSIYDFIVEKGFTGKYTIVKDYCRRFRRAQTKKATIRVEHTIGLSAQVDWKEQVTMTDWNGVSHTFSIFLYVLPYSKFKFLKLTLDQKQDTLFKCLFEAFKATGGIPKEIWFDNMSTVVDHKLSDFHHHRFNERFLSFSHDAGFHPIAYRPFRPQTKGCVEALARTIGRLKPYDEEFGTINDLNDIVNRLAKRLNHEKSQSNNQKPAELWAKEKEHFRPLNYDLTRYFDSVQTRKVSQDSMIRFQNHQYSVSPNYIGKEVEIKPAADGKSIHIFYQGSEIKKHDLTNKQFNYDPLDKHAILKSDLLEDKTDEEIDQYMLNNLSIYDQIGE